MTEEQLAVATSIRPTIRKLFGYAQDNVRFLLHRAAGRTRAGREQLRRDRFQLRGQPLAGQRMPCCAACIACSSRAANSIFSDVYADRRVPDAVKNDPVLYGECLGGALYWNDFLTLARRHGFADPRLETDRPLAITDPALAARAGNIRFYSATYRLFKLADLENACEETTARP